MAGRPKTPVIDLATYRRAYVTPIQLADCIGVTRRTIYHHIEKGALSVKRIGGVIRIRTIDARKYAQIDQIDAAVSA